MCSHQSVEATGAYEPSVSDPAQDRKQRLCCPVLGSSPPPNPPQGVQETWSMGNEADQLGSLSTTAGFASDRESADSQLSL